MATRKKYTLNDAFKDLEKLDELHSSGKITKSEHDRHSKISLKKLMKSPK